MATILDLRLNQHVASVPCESEDELRELFRVRAETVRSGVRGSPRGAKTPQLKEYKDFFRLELPGGYEIIAEETSPAAGLPLNECARAKLNCELYGPVFVLRRVCHEFVPLQAKTTLEGSDGEALRSASPRALRAHHVREQVTRLLLESDSVELVHKSHHIESLEVPAQNQ